MSGRAEPSGSRLMVLGSCGAWPEPGRACSGFVLEHDGARIVLDLGFGTLPRLLAHVGSTVGDGIDAVIVTHHHPDHSVDLHGLFRARWLGAPGARPLPLYSPEGVVDQVATLEGVPVATVREVLDWRPLPAGPWAVGPFELTSWSLPHFVPDAGVRLTAPGLCVAYTGDTGPDPALEDLGRDADLFIVEASDRDQRPGGRPASEERLHLSAADAARAARAAGARRVLLTHFWPGNDRSLSAREASRHFPGPVILAEEGLVVELA